MGDEFDVDDLLEAPYKVKAEPEVSCHRFVILLCTGGGVCCVLSGILKRKFNVLLLK